MMVKEYHPDVVVLDVMLPDINGKDVCQRIRSDPTLSDVRIVCISGMVEDDKISDLISCGKATNSSKSLSRSTSSST